MSPDMTPMTPRGATGAGTSREARGEASGAGDSQTPAQRLLDVKQAARFLNLSPWTIRSLGWSGQLAVVKVGRRVLYDLEDLSAFIAQNKRKEESR